MDTTKPNLDLKSGRNVAFKDPMMLGTTAFVFGFLIGSGRWGWLSDEIGRLAESLGVLVLNSVTQSFQEHNPELFSQRSRVTH